MSSLAHPRLLIVAGHDPSRGAGIDADRESARELAIEPLVVITAFTDQDDGSVRAIGAREPDEWLREALELARGGVDAVKFGLLPGAQHITAAAELARALRQRSKPPIPIVVDPVIESSSGVSFLDDAALRALRQELVVQGIVLTPNIPEAARLTGRPLLELTHDPERRIDAARELHRLGAAAVIIKGGHGTEDPIRDLIASSDGTIAWNEHPRVPGGGIRGSGCRYATRLAAELALGRSLAESAHAAGQYVARLIRARVG